MSDGFRRSVGLFSATMLIAGSMIGSGVLSATACGGSENDSTTLSTSAF